MKHVLIATFLTFALPVHALTEIADARSVYSAIPFSTNFATQDQRKAMALGIRSYWQVFDSRLPRLSPAEVTWVKQELDTSDNKRLNRLFSAREFHIWQLGELSDRCNNAAKDLVGSFKDKALLEYEMFYWSKVAACYHESGSNIVSYLQSSGLDTISDETDGHFLDNLILSKIINVIIPSAMVDAMGWSVSAE